MRSADAFDREATGLVSGIIAPVKGLNTNTPLGGLQPGYAITLDNWICQPDALVVRSGIEYSVTDFVQNPRTLMAYHSATADELFAAADDGIYDVTVAGVVGVPVEACTYEWGKHVNFATSAGQFLYFVNGVDKPKLYNGATWVAVDGVSIPAITGPTTTSLKDVETYRQRLYFLQNDFLGFYYLPADSVGGAATAFRIGSLCKRGGYAVAHGTWSIDGGSGPDDHYVIATSEGEVIVFRGSDPAVPANWTYFGTFYIGKPMGPRCFAKLGGDLLYLNENGILPLSGILQSTGLSYTAPISYNIQPTLQALASQWGSLKGWKIHVIPSRSLVIINIPKDAECNDVIQYVYNTLSKGWSSFSSWYLADLIEFGGKTIACSGGNTAELFKTTSDYGGLAITALCDTAYNRFGTRAQLLPILMRLIFGTTGKLNYAIGLAQDFSGEYNEVQYLGGAGTAGLWDSGLWNTALWGGGYKLNRNWVTIAAKGGISLSTRFRVTSNASSTVFIAADYKFAEQGLVS